MINRKRERIIICDPTWSPIADLQDWDDLTMTERLCDVGTGSVDCPATPHNRELLQPGNTLLKKYNGVTEMAGVFWPGETFRESGKIGIARVDWFDTNRYLKSLVALPDPAAESPALRTKEYDIRTGPASSVILGFAEWNAGQKALPSRRVFGLRIGDDPGIGGQITEFPTRFESLLELMQRLAIPNGLGFRIRTGDREHTLEVYQVRDLSDRYVFSEGLHNARNVDWTLNPPEATAVYAGGKGDLEAREIIEVTSELSRAEEALWGYRVEYFHDDNNSTGAALREGALRALEERCGTVEFSFEPVDTADVKLGVDYRIGDLIKGIARPQMIVNGRTIPPITVTKPIREKTTTISRAQGRRVRALAGDYGATSSSENTWNVKDVQRKLAALQRNR